MEGRHRLSSALALATLVLPLVTFYAGRPWQQVYDSGFFSTPLWGITAIALALIAHETLVPWNVWIGRWVMSIALISPFAESYSLAMATWGVAGMWVAMTVSKIERSRVVLWLTVFGLVECALLFAQWKGYYLAIGDWQFQTEIPHGTFGNPRYLAVALAMVGAVAPLWAVPIFLLGLVICKSYVALGALMIALFVRFRQQPVVYALAGAFCTIATLVVYKQRFFTHDSWDSRIGIWSLGMDEIVATPFSLVFGVGDGTWYTHMMFRQVGLWFALNGHSEYFQVFYERGIVGLVIAVAFLVRHRHWFWREPALVALAICCTSLSVLHLTMIAPIACVVIGMASREPCD